MSHDLVFQGRRMDSSFGYVVGGFRGFDLHGLGRDSEDWDLCRMPPSSDSWSFFYPTKLV